jgi:hypothetical protein
MSSLQTRKPKGAPSEPSQHLNRFRCAATSSNLKTPEAVETTSTNTVFFRISKRAGPLAHLKVLRGAQNEIRLHTDEFMSPGLHNSSDTYHRLLQSQLQHGIELSEGYHQRLWITKTKERKAFKDFTTQLEKYTQPFLHGFQRQTQKEELEIMLYNKTSQNKDADDGDTMRRWR